VTPTYGWPPDWSLAYGTGGDGSYFRELIGGTLAGGNAYYTSSGDTAFALVSYANGPGVVVNPAATSRLNVAGFASPATAGVAGNITLTAVDPYGNVTPSYAGTVHFASTDPRAVLPADTTLTNGVGTFSVTLKTAGAQALTATDSVSNSLRGSQSGIAVNPAATYSLTVAGFPSITTVGTAHPFTVTLRDFFGNLTPGYAGTVAFSSTDAQAALPAAYTFLAADQGTHTFSATLNTPGTWSLSVRDTLTSGLTGNQSSLQVYPPISLGSLSFGEWTAGRAGYSGAIAVSGGAGGYTGLSATGLPAGLRAALSGNSVLLGGTPSAAGTFTFTVSLLDSVGLAARQSYAFAVEPHTTLTWTGHGGDNLWSDSANWTGAAPVAGNTLDFGAGALQRTSVNDFAPGTPFSAIIFEDSGYALSGNAIRLSAGINATSAVAGTNSVALNIALTANQTFTVDPNGLLQLRGVLSGSTFGVTKAGGGTLTYAGSAANTYTGLTTVSGGQLQLDNSAGNAIAGALTVGAGASVWYVSHDNQVSDTATVTVGAGGAFDLNGRSDRVGAVVLSGGAVSTGTGTLTLGGNITSSSAGATATISGGLDLGGLTRTVTVAHGSAAEDLVVTANVSNGGLTKAGAGALVLSGNNTYAGPTAVAAVVLDVQSSSALGSTAGGTAVAAGATLEVEGTGLTLGDSLILGKGTAGASLAMPGGINTWAGNITLAGTDTISVGAGQLTLGGTISGAGGLTKIGAGTLLVNGNGNAFAGLATVSAGTLGGTGRVGRVTVSAGGHLAPGSGGPGALTGASLSFAPGSTFDVGIDGTTAGTGYDQLVCTGSVALGGATLNVSLGSFTPPSGSSFTIITRTSAGGGNTTFAGLAEGTTFGVGGTTFQITYLGGTGHHDVVLTVL
jgi:autotransporter-associated beta strand protein